MKAKALRILLWEDHLGDAPSLPREVWERETGSFESTHLLRRGDCWKMEHDSRDFLENASIKIQELMYGEISLRTVKKCLSKGFSL